MSATQTAFFEEWAQDQVNQIARDLIEQNPEIAKETPHLIGEVAKEIFFEIIGIVTSR